MNCFSLVVKLWVIGLTVVFAFQAVASGQIFDGLVKPAESRFLNRTQAVDPAASQAIVNLCDEISDEFSGEVLVVVVNSIGRNVSPRQYATDLFNTWGIGSKWKDNGILVFAALNDRVVEIVLGDGEDLDKDVNHAEVIVDQFILPNFQQEDYGAGLYEGTRACAARIFGMADLKSKVDLFPLAERAPGFRPIVEVKNVPDLNHLRPGKPVRQPPRDPWPWLLGIGGVLGVGIVIGGRYWLRYRRRTCSRCHLEMVPLSEEEGRSVFKSP